MKIKLITFSNTGMQEAPRWDVWGHVKEGHNKHLGTFHDEFDAMRKAHDYGLPVMRGSGNSSGVLEALKHLT